MPDISGEMVRIATMTVRIMGDINYSDDTNQKVVDEFQWSYLEDAANDQLPDGYYCKIDQA